MCGVFGYIGFEEHKLIAKASLEEIFLKFYDKDGK